MGSQQQHQQEGAEDEQVPEAATELVNAERLQQADHEATGHGADDGSQAADRGSDEPDGSGEGGRIRRDDAGIHAEEDSSHPAEAGGQQEGQVLDPRHGNPHLAGCIRVRRGGSHGQTVTPEPQPCPQAEHCSNGETDGDGIGCAEPDPADGQVVGRQRCRVFAGICPEQDLAQVVEHHGGREGGEQRGDRGRLNQRAHRREGDDPTDQGTGSCHGQQRQPPRPPTHANKPPAEHRTEADNGALGEVDHTRDAEDQGNADSD